MLKLTRWTAIVASAATVLPRLGRAQAAGPEGKGVKLGRGLVAGPKMLMLDEPSMGLAPLIVAQERGLFTKYGMPDVDVAKQARASGRPTFSGVAAGHDEFLYARHRSPAEAA